MSEPSGELDLKFLPDWLKESPAGNRYADYEGERGGRHDRDAGERRREPRGDRERPPRRDRDDRRGPRRDGPPSGKHGERRGQPRGDNRTGSGRPRDDRRDRDHARDHAPAAKPAVPTAQVKVEFLPEPNGLAGITRQIKGGTRAYPLFATARLFLEKPERHRVRITSLDPAVPLWQVGEDGPISFDRAALERAAFRGLREEYFREEVQQGEAPRGNFSNVARCRATGTLLGPTNYHAYQPALRKLYEERFSRRMSFQEFQQHEIEIVTDEKAVADWKEQARTTTTFSTLKEAEPLEFKTLGEAEQHFRKSYLAELVRSGQTLETSGPASRASGDRGIGAALRTGWEHEKQYPQNIVNQLRPAFQEAALHYFKHRKRTIYISPLRPQRAPKDQLFSEGIAAILSAVEASPRCTRHDLALKILGEQAIESPEAAARKAALAADLHYLVQAGHVIEFHDGTLDLPLVPGEKHPQHEKAEAAVTDESAEHERESDIPVDADSPVHAGIPHSTLSETPASSEPQPEPATAPSADVLSPPAAEALPIASPPDPPIGAPASNPCEQTE